MLLEHEYNRHPSHPNDFHTPMLFCHGVRDLVVKYDRGALAYEHLESTHSRMEWRDFYVGHEVCVEELRHVCAWLHRRFDVIRNKKNQKKISLPTAKSTLIGKKFCYWIEDPKSEKRKNSSCDGGVMSNFRSPKLIITILPSSSSPNQVELDHLAHFFLIQDLNLVRLYTLMDREDVIVNSLFGYHCWM